MEKAFNRITLMAGIDEEEGIISDYTISILDSNKRLLAEKNVKADDIKKRRITLDFDKIQCDNHYYLTIRKNQTSYGDIHFYIRNTYFLDSYRGQLIVDGAGDFVNDLNMVVSYSVKQPYFTFGRRMLFNGTYAVISILCFVYILKEQKDPGAFHEEYDRGMLNVLLLLIAREKRPEKSEWSRADKRIFKRQKNPL